MPRHDRRSPIYPIDTIPRSDSDASSLSRRLHRDPSDARHPPRRSVRPSTPFDLALRPVPSGRRITTSRTESQVAPGHARRMISRVTDSLLGEWSTLGVCGSRRADWYDSRPPTAFAAATRHPLSTSTSYSGRRYPSRPSIVSFSTPSPVIGYSLSTTFHPLGSPRYPCSIVVVPSTVCHRPPRSCDTSPRAGAYEVASRCWRPPHGFDSRRNDQGRVLVHPRPGVVLELGGGERREESAASGRVGHDGRVSRVDRGRGLRG